MIVQLGCCERIAKVLLGVFWNCSRNINSPIFNAFAYAYEIRSSGML